MKRNKSHKLPPQLADLAKAISQQEIDKGKDKEIRVLNRLEALFKTKGEFRFDEVIYIADSMSAKTLARVMCVLAEAMDALHQNQHNREIEEDSHELLTAYATQALLVKRISLTYEQKLIEALYILLGFLDFQKIDIRTRIEYQYGYESKKRVKK